MSNLREETKNTEHDYVAWYGGYNCYSCNWAEAGEDCFGNVEIECFCNASLDKTPTDWSLGDSKNCATWQERLPWRQL